MACPVLESRLPQSNAALLRIKRRKDPIDDRTLGGRSSGSFGGEAVRHRRKNPVRHVPFGLQNRFLVRRSSVSMEEFQPGGGDSKRFSSGEEPEPCRRAAKGSRYVREGLNSSCTWPWSTHGKAAQPSFCCIVAVTGRGANDRFRNSSVRTSSLTWIDEEPVMTDVPSHAIVWELEETQVLLSPDPSMPAWSSRSDETSFPPCRGRLRAKSTCTTARRSACTSRQGAQDTLSSPAERTAPAAGEWRGITPSSGSRLARTEETSSRSAAHDGPRALRCLLRSELNAAVMSLLRHF